MSKKKVFKRIGIAFAILLFLIITTVSIAIWFVFTPERITPFIRKQAASYITCKSTIGEVELTFFSTFPRFGLKVSQFELINPMPNAPSDTLVCAEQFIGIVDVGAWWKKDQIVLNDMQLLNGKVNIFVDSLGHANYNITKPDTVQTPIDTAKSKSSINLIDIKNVEFKNVDLSYIDQTQKLQAGIRNLKVKFSGSIVSDSLNMRAIVSDSKISFSYAGEKYLSNDLIKFDIPAQVILSKQFIKFGNAQASINDINLEFTGTVENDSKHNRINTNIDYKSEKFPVPSALKLVPPSYESYLEGLTMDGVASSDGKITGFYCDTVMPLMDLHVVLYEGNITYSSLPFPLSNTKGDCVFHSDITHDNITYFRINSFSAITPKSSFTTRGTIDHLFSDIFIDVTTNANLDLSEVSPMIPADLKMTLKGNANGSVRTAFSMVMLDKMQIDRMIFSGSAVALSNFEATYDTIFLKADKAKVDFSMPNTNPSKKSLRYLYSKINGNNIVASTKCYKANLINALITLETSDVMDSTKLPDVACSFAVDSLAASMDTIKFTSSKPWGKFTMITTKDKKSKDFLEVEYSNSHMSTSMGSKVSMQMGKSNLFANVLDFFGKPEVKLNYSGNAITAQMDTISVKMDKAQLNAEVADISQPKIKFAYNGDNLNMQMGKSNSVKVNKIQMNTDVVNDTTQKDIFLQWQVKGFLNMEKGVISTSALTQQLEIPSIKMDFDPEVFNIKESRLKIDRSDFSLSGTLKNIKSYFRKDSLLRGNFNFVSDQTDVLQLMSLTSGIGNEKTDSISKSAKTTNTTSGSGPYMVPKGIDITLKTNINKAFFGTEIAKDISGSVRVKDGIMVLDGLTFTTPASKMQLSAMYKTPRKNHLYAFFDYHMLDVNIESLIKMFPLVDSIMPMLRSFKGQGEFHMAAEANFDSLYNPKIPSILGTASIKGNNLVLMDGETFTNIAKKLRFNKKAENKVDSLSAEFTLIKRKIEIYPFMIVMDKYKAVIAGKHNMDMSFDYNISLVQSPIPFKLCVDVKGTMDNLDYKLVKCKYGDLYRPSSKYVLQNKQLELRKIIRESLLKNVKKSSEK